MTKPRFSTTRELFGIIGKVQNASAIQRTWNAYFDQQAIDAFMDKYPTVVETIPERLSEMFSFDRRLYIVGEDIQQHIVPLLDVLDASVVDAVNVIVNHEGVFTGHFDAESPENVDYILKKYVYKN